MTDPELAAFLGIAGTKKCAEIMASITPEQRATYDSMAKTEHEISLWQAGLGPKPAGVIVCGCRGLKRGHSKCRRAASR